MLTTQTYWEHHTETNANRENGLPDRGRNFHATTSELVQGLAVVRAEGLAPPMSILPVAAKQTVELCISVTM